jgi:hypothetical protein
MSLTNSGPERQAAVRYAVEHNCTFDEAALALERARAEADLEKFKDNKPLKKTLKRYLKALDRAEEEAKEENRIRIAMGGR